MNSIIELSKMAVPLIVGIVVIRSLCINRLPKQTFLALWAVAVVRLLVPFSIPSRLSIQTLGRWVSEALPKAPAVEEVIRPVVQYIPSTLEVVPKDTAALAENLPVPGPTISWLLWIWLGVAVLCAAYFAITYVISRRRFGESLPVEHEGIRRWLAQSPLRRPVQVRYTDQIISPLTYGILRPVILLPKSALYLPVERLSCILTHEYTHIRRFDALWKLVLAAVLCLHWFNPLVWVLYVLANRDIELACDEAVLRTMGDTLKSSYAMTLLGMEEKRCHSTPLYSNFSKYAIEERIHAIMKMKGTSLWGTILALALVICMTIVFATSAMAAQPEELTAGVAAIDTAVASTAPLNDYSTATMSVQEIEWYTYDEYKAWLDGEKAALQGLVGTGAKGWTASSGVFEWTQEKVDETIRMYEDMLAQIGQGLMVSKPTEGNPDVSFSMRASELMGVEAVAVEVMDAPSAAGYAVAGSAVPAMGTTAAMSMQPVTYTYASTITEAAPAETFFFSMAPAAEIGYVAETCPAYSSVATTGATARLYPTNDTVHITMTMQDAGMVSSVPVVPFTSAAADVRMATEAVPGTLATATEYQIVANVEGIPAVASRAYAVTEGSAAIQVAPMMDVQWQPATGTFAQASAEMPATARIAGVGEAATEPFFTATISVGDKVQAGIGPYSTLEALNDAVNEFCRAQVRAGLMSQAQANEILKDYVK